MSGHAKHLDTAYQRLRMLHAMQTDKGNNETAFEINSIMKDLIKLRDILNDPTVSIVKEQAES